MKHQAVRAAEAATDLQTIKFTMAGLTPDYNQEGVFNLTVDMRPLDLSHVMQVLMEQGISERLAEEATEGMHEFIFGRQLAEHFARNMKRVG
jgi:hypothetical protein